MSEAKKSTKFLWTERVGSRLSFSRVNLGELARGLISPDAPTRRMSFFFFLSLAGFVCFLGLVGYRLNDLRARHSLQLSEAEKGAKHLGEFLARQADEAKQKAVQVPVGTFSIELQPMEGQRRIPGIQNMAEVELYLSCDSKETREYIETNLIKARNQITNFFTAMDRTELTSREGKKKIKKGILELLNTWLPRGKVEDVYITRFLMT